MLRPATGALRICRKKAEGGAEGSSTHCSQEDPEFGLQNMQEEALVW